MTLYDSLAPGRQAHVRVALIALESTHRPLPGTLFPALAEATLRHVVEEMLAASGRVLIAAPGGYISGYDDTIAQRLAQEGLGILPSIDRAVLAFVVLLSVAMPRAAGLLPADASWTTGIPVSEERFNGSRLQDVDTGPAIKRLRDASLLHTIPGKGLALGDQFHRLTKQATTALFDQLILLAEPKGSLAESIRRRLAGVSSHPSSNGAVQ